MTKLNAIEINKKLGVKVFDENKLDILTIIKYSNKEIEELFIDDLIYDGKWTKRLIKLVNEMEQE